MGERKRGPMSQDTPAGRAPFLAVLIDADNIPARHAEAILNEIAAYGDPGLRRVYGDWSSTALTQWKEQARNLGLVMHQQSANTKGKNASDIGLVIDAMDILHAGKVEGFVLVSSDSDFTRLASRIREDNMQVIGVGEQKTPESLRKVCNRFLFIENIVGADSAGTTEAKVEAQPTDAAPVTRMLPKKAQPLILEAMKKIDPEQEWYALGQLGQVITQMNPDFDPRSYGEKKLSDLIRKLHHRFEVSQGPNNSVIVRDKA
jgi:predicted nuclease of predicted toxin-antitoxin system